MPADLEGRNLQGRITKVDWMRGSSSGYIYSYISNVRKSSRERMNKQIVIDTCSDIHRAYQNPYRYARTIQIRAYAMRTVRFK